MQRAIVITGGTAGLGFEAARAIALGHYPGAEQDTTAYLLVLASRTDKDKAADVLNREASAAGRSARAVFHSLDLADLDSVRQFASLWVGDRDKSKNTMNTSQPLPRISALLLNAGLQFPGPLQTTAAGIESTFSINHVGHALLFHLLVPFLDTTPESTPRVVVTSSGTHDPAQHSGLPDAVYTSAHDLAYPPADMVDINGRQRYASSKLANVLWTYALDRQIRGSTDLHVAVNAFDPGLMPGTGLAREASGIVKLLWSRVLPNVLPVLRYLVSPNIHTAQESGENLARVAVGVEQQGVSGKYFEMRQPIASSTDSYDTAKQDDLWEWTVKYVAEDAAEEARFRRFE
ncbi:dehydrogenase reductase [Ophiostoma piceae UAMH 11346]|uniref:Dehydrogenase reductase n=1 Tax=Ophiostoma piceae (strain UAMH 11346) TaxID=1262450 RepID=S3CPQ7_OPHP1|nr:dehydrogenase reductase [Ophiostoma piceae UAMH 11346]